MSEQQTEQQTEPKCNLRRDLKAMKFCPELEARLEPEQFNPSRGKGIYQVLVANIHDSPLTYQCYGAAYKRDRKDAGLMLHFCPWCGVQLITDEGKPNYQDEPATPATEVVP